MDESTPFRSVVFDVFKWKACIENHGFLSLICVKSQRDEKEEIKEDSTRMTKYAQFACVSLPYII